MRSAAPPYGRGGGRRQVARTGLGPAVTESVPVPFADVPFADVNCSDRPRPGSG